MRDIQVHATSAGLVGGLLLALLTVGCRPDFPRCRTDEDCGHEKGTPLRVCVNGQCQECGRDGDCPGDKPHCLQNRCVQCLNNVNCPATSPFCDQNRCSQECQTDADCARRGKAGSICRDRTCIAACRCHLDVECPLGQVCENCACQNKLTCLDETIHFAFDQSDLLPAARAALERIALCLQEHSFARVLIAGHCDERGSEAYNYALGERRAQAARGYLETMGMRLYQLYIISYGETRPLCTEQTESCWSQNRRVEFKLQ